jgi:hypothetical protein
VRYCDRSRDCCEPPVGIIETLLGIDDDQRPLLVRVAAHRPALARDLIDHNEITPAVNQIEIHPFVQEQPPAGVVVATIGGDGPVPAAGSRLRHDLASWRWGTSERSRHVGRPHPT